MAFKKFNVSKPEKYIDKNNVEKTMWHNVGVYTEFTKQDGSVSRILEIPAIGLKANLFEQQPKPAQTTARPVAPVAPVAEAPLEYPEEEINPDDIPF